MRYVLAIFFPWLSLFTIGKFGQGIICLLLQLTLIGWIPAMIWSITSVTRYYQEKQMDRLVGAIGGVGAAVKAAPVPPDIPERRAPAWRPEPQQGGPTVEDYLRSTPEYAAPPPRHARAANEPSARPSASAHGYDDRKWHALVRFDDEIAAAAARVRALGERWEHELARSYLLLNDKSYLAALVDKITRDAQAQSA